MIIVSSFSIVRYHLFRRIATRFQTHILSPTSYRQDNRFNHYPRRNRKLLLSKREIHRLYAAVRRDGMTLVPMKIYFNAKGLAKIDLALAQGKKNYDKRETEKKRDWDRQKHRILREHN